MTFYAQELRKILLHNFPAERLMCIDRVVFICLSGNRRARIEFVTGQTADHYDRIRVSIISITDGEIDRLTLLHWEYFTRDKRLNCIPHIWNDYGKTEWYAQPDAEGFSAISKAIHDYIMLFA